MPEKFKFNHLFSIVKITIKDWLADEPFYLSAGVAYYSMLAMPGLLVLIIRLVGTFYKEDEVQTEITNQVSQVLGQDAATQIDTIIRQASEAPDSVLATVISIGTLVFGATGVFFALQKSLNKVWDVKISPKTGILHTVKSRAIGLGLIVVVGFLLLVFLLISTLLSVVSNWMEANLPDYLFYLIYVVNFILSTSIFTLLFAIIYKVLPDVIIGWKSLWVGSIVTALLFNLGKYLMSLYFGNTDPGSSYGIAGSIVVLLLWVSYSCLLIFFGAEFTQVYARRYGQPIKPAKHAVRIKLVEYEEEKGEKA
jgi:membrane protein